MNFKKIICLTAILVAATSANAFADEVYKTLSPTVDTYIDKANPNTNYSQKDTMFLKPVSGNFTDRENSNRSYGLIRFDMDDWTEEDLEKATCIKLRLSTGNDVSNAVTTNGMDGVDYTKIGVEWMADVLQVLGLQRGLQVNADGTETEINYKTSWNEKTTWNTAGGLQLITTGNTLRGGIVDACAKNTTYEIDVTDYVVYSMLYDEYGGKNVVSFKIQKMLQNYMWRENKFENGFSVYSSEASNPDLQPMLILYSLSTEDRINEALESIDLGDMNNVYTDLELPDSIDGVSITWTTSNAGAMTNEGIVTIGDSDVDVVLTATAEDDGVTKTKEFKIRVKSSDYIRTLLNEKMSEIAFKNFSSEPVNRVTKDLTLPAELIEGYKVTYTSSDSDVLTIGETTATVHRSEDDTKVSFVVKCEYDKIPDIYVEKQFDVYVLGTNSTSGGSGGSGGGGGGAAGGGSNVDSGDVPNINPGSNTGAGSAGTGISTGEERVFKDVSNDFWAKSYIAGLKNKGIVDGDENGNFRPNDKITREEAVKLIVLSFGLEDKDAVCSFTDVPQDAWYYTYVASANTAKVVNGMSNEMFGTGMNITRQDLAVMLYNSLKSTGKITGDEDVTDTQFADNDTISDYAKNAVYYLKSEGILDGYDDGSFMPQNSATRAEVSKVIYMLMD